jgi:hypothetical protein
MGRAHQTQKKPARSESETNALATRKGINIINRILVCKNHRIHEDLQMNTVLSEIKQWSAKYVRKLENHTNALEPII